MNIVLKIYFVTMKCTFRKDRSNITSSRKYIIEDQVLNNEIQNVGCLEIVYLDATPIYPDCSHLAHITIITINAIMGDNHTSSVKRQFANLHDKYDNDTNT